MVTAPPVTVPTARPAAVRAGPARSAGGALAANGPAEGRIDVKTLNAFFGTSQAVREVSLDMPERCVTAIIGASGSGKSTLLRCLNRMHETVPTARVSGQVQLDGRDIYARDVNPIAVRRHIGMVFQRPTPFPTMSIRENIAAGLRVASRKHLFESRDQHDC